jgi:hypothetical protein
MSAARASAHEPAETTHCREETFSMKATDHLSRRALAGVCAIFTLLIVLLSGVTTASAAGSDYEFTFFDVNYTEKDSTPAYPTDDPPATQAGSHPFAMTTEIHLGYTEPQPPPYPWLVNEQLKDIIIEQIAGLSGDATAYPRCSTADLLTSVPGTTMPVCPDDTAVGAVALNLIGPSPFIYLNAAVYNVEPPPGVAVRLGFSVLDVRVYFDVTVKQGGEYNITASGIGVPQTLMVFGGTFQIWGSPSDEAHDDIRGHCIGSGFSASSQGAINLAAGSSGKCEVSTPPRAFLTLPTNCDGPKVTRYMSASWDNPGVWLTGSSVTHDKSEPPSPQGFVGCEKLGFAPEVETQTTADSAETGTGLDFDVDFHDEGLSDPDGLAESTAKKVVTALPKGVTINPSIGEGLGVCTPADLDREALGSIPGDGCPNSSKIGTLHLDTPLLDEAIDGSVYLAQQDDPTTSAPGAENPFDSLVALYLVLRNPNAGVLIKLPMKVEPDPTTGQLVATLDNAPQLPFDHFNFHFREGQRAPLVTPNACGVYTTETKFYPWSDPANPRTVTSSFEITRGIGGGSCPPAGIPPFHPSFEAGAVNNNAGSFSPFIMRLVREDGEQDLTKFSSVLPPGVVGKLAGVGKCPDSAVTIAKSKTGRQEQASPSCPANSEIGRTLAGAGVGGALTYVPGRLYLGGPYKGAPLSVISITPAVAGPFDAGTVAVRLGLDLNPKTAEVEVDGSASDPIPHILKGIVLKLRDLRVYVDRPNFTLNPTSCDESKAKATLFGSFLDVFDPADDKSVDLATRYQAANCANLGFKPKLSLNLEGGTKRGAHPGLKALYTPREGDANVEDLVVRLPRSAFLDQAHIRTICTRVQFAADSCPKGAQYGYIKAWTPLLEEPLQGPVWLRSSNHKLPDMVFDLHGLVDVEVVTRIDSARGGIRATVNDSPDAPLTKVELRMQGGKKGLIVNSRDLCNATSRATTELTAHNGKQLKSNPVMRADGCGGKPKARRAGR